MNREEIQSKIIHIAAAQAGVDPAEVTPATHFVNDLEFDSLDVMEFAMEVEDELNASIPDDQVEKMHTVADVVDFLAEQPDLNVHAPDVQDALLDVARFWLIRTSSYQHSMFDVRCWMLDVIAFSSFALTPPDAEGKGE